jgi:alpha-tubulin suppressor-like RCC1 family protein
MYCWGSGDNGAIGLAVGHGGIRNTPLLIADAPASALVAAGFQFTCTLKDGAVSCFGYNGYTVVTGASTFSNRQTSGDIGPATSIAAAESGGHLCAIATEPAAGLYCWGISQGAIGNGPVSGTQTSGPFLAISGSVKQVAVGEAHTCGLTMANELYCWGGNMAVGPTAQFAATTPITISDRTFASVAAGGRSTCATTTDGALYCWGSDSFGQLGNGGANSDTNVPSLVSGVTDVAQVALGGYHTCAVQTAGALYCWGKGDDGQLGLGNFTSQTTPVLVTGLDHVALVGLGYDHTCAATSTTGALYCWGSASYGQLGDGTAISKNTPTLVTFA